MRAASGVCAGIVEVDVLKKLLSKENMYALLLSLILVAILILTADQSPQWIYQGF
jgi:hypothetical protein